MSTSSTTPACSAPGSTSSPGLSVPKVTVTSARTATPSTSPVDASTPLGTSTATTQRLGQVARRRSPLPRAVRRCPPMPRIPSMTRSARRGTASTTRDHRCGAASRVRPRAPGRRAARASTRAPRAASQRSGDERVAAVVAAADEQHDARAVDPRQQVGAHRREAGGGALHQGAVRQGVEQHLLGGAHRRPRRGRSAPQSSTSTTADAMPASWLSETWVRRTPSSVARRSTVPRMVRCGRPSSTPIAPRRRASAARPGHRAPSPGPPLPRSAPPAMPGGSCCSASVKSRARSRGARCNVRVKRSTSTTSMPTPRITCLPSHADGRRAPPAGRHRAAVRACRSDADACPGSPDREGASRWSAGC